MIASAALALSLFSLAPPAPLTPRPPETERTITTGAKAAPPTWHLDLGLELEYSMFLGVHRRTLAILGDSSSLSPFGPRTSLALRGERFLAGASVTLFPSRSLAFANDFFVAWIKRWSRLSLQLGGGLGYLLTLKGTKVPTYTDAYAGPSLHGSLRLRWDLPRRCFVTGSLALYLYPTLPLMIVPVGIDLRWTLGGGFAL